TGGIQRTPPRELLICGLKVRFLRGSPLFPNHLPRSGGHSVAPARIWRSSAFCRMRVNTCRTFRVHDHPLARDKDTDTAVDSRERKLRVDIKSAQTQTLARRPPIFQVLRIVSLALPLLGAGFYLAGGTRRYRG